MIRCLCFIFVSVTLLSCYKIEKCKNCISSELVDPSNNNSQQMTDFLQRFDITAVGSPQSQTFERRGCGKLISIYFANPYAAKNVNSFIEIMVDSTKKYKYPVAIGNRPIRQKYTSPSLLYKEGQCFQLPLGNGVFFSKSCRVSFVVSPIMSNPLPKGNGRGRFENILITWATAADSTNLMN